MHWLVREGFPICCEDSTALKKGPHSFGGDQDGPRVSLARIHQCQTAGDHWENEVILHRSSMCHRNVAHNSIISHPRQLILTPGNYFPPQAGQIGRDESSSRLANALRHGLRLHRIPLQRLCSPSIASSVLSIILSGFSLNWTKSPDSWRQVLQCRLVCSTWRDFIDTEVLNLIAIDASVSSPFRPWHYLSEMCQVVERHPDTVSERLWRTGVEAHSMLYCGGEVSRRLDILMLFWRLWSMVWPQACF